MTEAVNNSYIIGNLLRFEREGDFYFLQILKRRKDNPGLYKDMTVIKNYFIYSKQEYLELIPRIVEECETNNARAYFRLNRRNSQRVALETLRKTSEFLLNGNYRAVRGAYDSAAGESCSEPYKTWVVDVDTKSNVEIGIVTAAIKILCKEANQDGDIIALIPTKNGWHIICRPFNLIKAKEEYGIPWDVHKDNPTILYVP